VLCGSTYLNKRFRSALQRKLQDVDNMHGIEAKIEDAVKEFEEKSKPAFHGAGPSHPFKIIGLLDDPERGFRNECVWFSACV
jgi:predicted proteasome-type protease